MLCTFVVGSVLASVIEWCWCSRRENLKPTADGHFIVTGCVVTVAVAGVVVIIIVIVVSSRVTIRWLVVPT